MQEQMDTICKDISEIKTDVAVMKVDVAHHIKRCDLLEDSVEVLKKNSAMAQGAVYFIGFVATLATIVDVYLKISHH